MPKKILITGGSGFIGHHFVDYILRKTDWEIVLLERLNFVGNLNRISELPSYADNHKRVRMVCHDLRCAINSSIAKDIGEVNYVVHFAASTHVDRAIEDPMPFVLDNCVGTTNLLLFAKSLKNLELFINFSTDEVFGPAPTGTYHKEGAAHHPSNMYSATKSFQEKAGEAFFVTYGLPVINTHTMNNFGERQHPEKFVPKTIRSIIENQPMPIYANLENGEARDISSRVWIYAENTADATFFLIQNGRPGEEYNIIGPDEYDVLTLAKMIAKILGKELIPEFVGFYNARPGHDKRYALDGSKMKNMGWNPPVSFEDALRKTVEFTTKNPKWS